MKFKNEIIINAPREYVVEKFINHDNMPIWRPSIISAEYLSGLPGRIGATRRILFQRKDRKSYMVETILKKQLPELYKVMERKNYDKTYRTYQFDMVDENTTKLTLINEYIYLGLLRLYGYFLIPFYRKKYQGELTLLKIFIETQLKN